AARGTDHRDDLFVEILELIGRRLALEANQVFRLAHETALYGTAAPCRILVGGGSTRRGRAVHAYRTEDWTKRATSVPFSITDAYTCVSAVPVSTTTEKLSPSVISGNND